MIHGKITQQQLDTCIDVLEWIKSHTEKNEPYAVNFIQAIDDARDQISPELADYE